MINTRLSSNYKLLRNRGKSTKLGVIIRPQDSLVIAINKKYFRGVGDVSPQAGVHFVPTIDSAYQGTLEQSYTTYPQTYVNIVNSRSGVNR